MVNMFFELSMRIYMSFEVVEKKLGVEVVFFDVVSFSMIKGEMFYDILFIM